MNYILVFYLIFSSVNGLIVEYFLRIVCQCNGHSTCPYNSSACNQPCGNMTQGEKCERCVPGYYGIAINGGTCVRKYQIYLILSYPVFC